MSPSTDRLRDLPSIDRLLADERARALVARFRRDHVLRRSREVLDDLRRAIREGRVVDAAALSDDGILSALERRLAADAALSMTRVVNATGTMLHTNLGRAVLARTAVNAVLAAATSAVTLEFDLAAGERGRREDAIERLLVELTGAEAATVVNNNAAAVLVGLNTLGEGREVIVSRGELIEIGGAFRLPDIMAKSGVRLREVGTTNRTHLADYERAIGPDTALLLKVHTSNYRVVGFSSEVGLADLVALGRSRGVPVMEDLGSGALVDLTEYGLPKEPVVAERIALGADVVTFSGDKILGGPQAGLVVGAADAVRRIAANPLHRAMRCGKLTLAALEATLNVYRQSTDLAADLPTLGAFTRPIDELETVGRAAAAALERALGAGYRVTLENSTAQVGSGALPTEDIPSKVIAIAHDTDSADRIAARFRASAPPILGRIRGDRFLLDLRLIHDPNDLVPQVR